MKPSAPVTATIADSVAAPSWKSVLETEWYPIGVRRRLQEGCRRDRPNVCRSRQETARAAYGTERRASRSARHTRPSVRADHTLELFHALESARGRLRLAVGADPADDPLRGADRVAGT